MKGFEQKWFSVHGHCWSFGSIIIFLAWMLEGFNMWGYPGQQFMVVKVMIIVADDQLIGLLIPLPISWVLCGQQHDPGSFNDIQTSS